MKITLAILNVVLLLFIAYKVWRAEKSSIRKYFWPALLLKWIAGICLGLLYSYYYPVGDTFAYFHDGVKLAEVARTDFVSYLKFLWSGDQSFPFSSTLIYSQPRALFLSKISSLLCVVTGDNYWIITVYFSSISFAGAWLLTKKITELYARAELPAVLSFLFFPTIVFWSAGLIKESIAMACLFFLSVIFLSVWRKEGVGWLNILLSLISFWLLWNLKYYYLAIFLPVVFTALVFRFVVSRFNIERTPIKLLTWSLIFVIPLALVMLLHPNFYPQRFMGVVVSSYYEFASISEPQDLIHYNSLTATPWSIFRNAPWAFISGLFRPFITEAQTFFQYLAAIENMILLLLAIPALSRLKKVADSGYRFLVFSTLVYVTLLCVFLALSTPNFGTLSRYRIGFLPYFVLLLTIENPLINKMMTLKIFRNVVK